MTEIGDHRSEQVNRMQRGRFASLVGACACAMAVFAVDSSFAAQQPPGPTCSIVTKQEYDSAKKQYLLQTRFSRYVRTGRLGRRQYWYCNS